MKKAKKSQAKYSLKLNGLKNENLHEKKSEKNKHEFYEAKLASDEKKCEKNRQWPCFHLPVFI